MDIEHLGRSNTGLNKIFDELNREFISSCIDNLQTLGTDSCLAPLAADYICHCLKVLSDNDPGDGNASTPFYNLGTRIQSLMDAYQLAAADLGKKRKVSRLPTSPTKPVLVSQKQSEDTSRNRTETLDVEESNQLFTEVEHPSSAPESNVKKPFAPESAGHRSFGLESIIPKPLNIDYRVTMPFASNPKGAETNAGEQKISSQNIMDPNISTSEVLWSKSDEPDFSRNVFKSKSYKESDNIESGITFNGFVLGDKGSAFPGFTPPPPPVFNGFGAGITGTSTPIQLTSEQEDEDEKREKEAQAHEFVPVVEDGALYTTKCKIFQKSESEEKFVVRGIGMLYIQKRKDEFYRLLIRADNTLGTVLLNMSVTPDIPITLNIGKKQVLMIDPHVPCPITILVKTPKDAQALYDILKKCQSYS